jgi:ribosomal protein L7/L12
MRIRVEAARAAQTASLEPDDGARAGTIRAGTDFRRMNACRPGVHISNLMPRAPLETREYSANVLMLMVKGAWVGEANPITVISVGSRRIQVIKVLSELLQIPLPEARTLLSSLPCNIPVVGGTEVRDRWEAALLDTGASVQRTFTAVVGEKPDWVITQGVEQSSESGRHEVHLIDGGRGTMASIDVIRVVSEYSRLGLFEAKELVEGGESCWRTNDEGQAMHLKRDLEDAGAYVEYRIVEQLRHSCAPHASSRYPAAHWSATRVDGPRPS